MSTIVDLLEQLPLPRGVTPGATVIHVDLERDEVLWSDGRITDLFAHRFVYADQRGESP